MPGIALTPEDIRRQCRHELALRARSGTAAGAEEILRYGAFVGSVVECHSFLDRAMDYSRAHIAAMEKAGRSVHNGTVILADCLGASKGRFDRAWHAPTGGLWGCLIHANTLLARSRGLISLAVGVACCEAVRDMGAAAQLRWVNDVLVHGRKVAGFLIEGFISPSHREGYNLIGFGININNSYFPSELRETAIALTEVLRHPLDLNLFARTFLAKLSFNLGLLYYEEERELRDEQGSDGEANIDCCSAGGGSRIRSAAESSMVSMSCRNPSIGRLLKAYPIPAGLSCVWTMVMKRPNTAERSAISDPI